MREGDEECHICRDDIPATIAFVPCKHKVCFGCMENMRAKNIFKVRLGQPNSRQQQQQRHGHPPTPPPPCHPPCLPHPLSLWVVHSGY